MIIANGEKIPVPCYTGECDLKVVNGRVFLKGYEYKNGEWKRSLMAIWHWVF